MIDRFLRGLGFGSGFGWPVLMLAVVPAAAQFGYPSQAPHPPQAVGPAQSGGARNPACLRLESQLTSIDRGVVDPAKADQIRRYEDAAAKQQTDLDRLGQQSQRLGCQGGGFFAIFSGQSPQCGPLNNQIQQARANLDRTLTDLQRLQGNSGEREGQRRGILMALGQNDCGPQYRQYANSGPGGFLENLFGGVPAAPGAPLAGTYRTLCVRTCDGYYFPISYSTVPSRFQDDERLCQRQCPAAEAVLYSHRNPGEDVARAVSASGRIYTDLPTAFSYRKTFNPACTCRAPGQSWAEALRPSDDQTIERGDIVVTEERAKQLSQPRFDAQGKPVNLDPNPGRVAPAGRTAPVTSTGLAPVGASAQPTGAGKSAATPTAAPATAATPEEPIEADPAKRKVRSVGPTSYPVR